MNKPASETAAFLEAGRTWVPSKAGSGERTVTGTGTSRGGTMTVSYRRRSGRHRRVFLVDWQAWVEKYDAEVKND